MSVAPRDRPAPGPGATLSQPAVRPLPDFGLRLRRQRRLIGMKQSHVAEMAGVCQTTVSRWEAGVIEPDRGLAERVLRALGPCASADPALRRMVGSSRLPMHLVTDADHRLIAVSPERAAEWGVPGDDYLGRSLWPFATPAITSAEHQLAGRGWWNDPTPEPMRVHVEAARSGALRIAAGLMLWERLWLSDGTPARLCTTVA